LLNLLKGSGSNVIVQDEDIKFYETLQYENSKSILRLESEIKYLREQNLMLLKRLGISNDTRPTTNASEFNPIPGYKNLRSRIDEKERESRINYEKEEERRVKEG
jgi:hypothetical protein